jgi:putative nucleotidyltransferase with HDIG domain
MIAGNIRFKLSLFISTLLLLFTFILSLIAIEAMDRHLKIELITRATSLNKSTAALAAYSMLSQDLLGIDNIVSKLKATNRDIEYVAVIGLDKKILAHSDLERRGETYRTSRKGTIIKKEEDGTIVSEVISPAENYFDVMTQIIFHGKQIGTMVTRINKSVLLAAQNDVHKKIAAGFVVSLLLGVISIVVLSSFITRPIKELALGVHELKEGNRVKQLRIYSNDELGRLTKSFNEMATLITDQQDQLGKYAHDLEEAYVSTVRVLAAAIDARDPYTHGHSTRVARLAVSMGAALGLSEEELEDLEVASLFHDIGKLKTPDDILLKPGGHDTEEYRVMACHPNDGADILKRARSLEKYIPAVRHHHEWYNGSGYPDGLQGEDIPFFASIISIADAFDAMTSTRPYRSELSREYAVEQLVLQAGKQFNPELVEVFLKTVNTAAMAEEQSYSARVMDE